MKPLASALNRQAKFDLPTANATFLPGKMPCKNGMSLRYSCICSALLLVEMTTFFPMAMAMAA